MIELRVGWKKMKREWEGRSVLVVGEKVGFGCGRW